MESIVSDSRGGLAGAPTSPSAGSRPSNPHLPRAGASFQSLPSRNGGPEGVAGVRPMPRAAPQTAAWLPRGWGGAPGHR